MKLQMSNVVTIITTNQRRCSQPNCRNPTTSKSKNKRGCLVDHWHRDGKGGFLCHRCYNRERYRKRVITTRQIGNDTEVMEMPLSFLRKKMPPCFRNRNEVDLIAHVLDIVSDSNKIVSMRVIRMIAGFNWDNFRATLADMATHGLINVESHERYDRAVVKITPIGVRFLGIYRRIVSLIAWIN